MARKRTRRLVPAELLAARRDVRRRGVKLGTFSKLSLRRNAQTVRRMVRKAGL